MKERVMKSHSILIVLAATVLLVEAAYAEAIYIEATVTQMEKNGTRDVLSRPHVSVRSGEEATIKVVTDQPVSLTDRTQDSTNSTHAVKFVEAGVILRITPTVTEDQIKYNGSLRIVDVGEQDFEKGVYVFLESCAYFHELTNDSGMRTFTMKSPKGKTVEVVLKLTVNTPQEKEANKTIEETSR
jgi:hypothetical protein